MFAPEYLPYAGAFYGADAFYPETAVLANDMPLHASLEDHEFDFYHPLSDGLYHHNDFHGHGDFSDYALHGLDHEAYWGHPDYNLMYLKGGNLGAKIKGAASRAGGAIKRGAQAAGRAAGKAGRFVAANKEAIKTGVHYGAVGVGALGRATGNGKIKAAGALAKRADKSLQKYTMMQMRQMYGQ